jgi:2-desacetyl-2-hydroxyethyl bacteriochlorophyllide A dehydrogenase
MKAAVITGRKIIEYKDVPKPTPGPRDCLAKVHAVGLCGTDMELYYGTMPYFEMGLSKYPIIPGHEWSGTVEAVGSEVTLFKVGDKVTADVSIGCGLCVNCKKGRYNFCSNQREVGISGGKEGAFAEYIIMPEAFLYSIPEGLSMEAATLVEPTATVVKSIRNTPVILGDVALVLGAGPIGMVGFQAVRAAGARRVILADLSDFKLNLAKELGADRIVNTAKENLTDVVEEESSGQGIDYLLEATGNAQLAAGIPALVRRGGTINVLGIYPEAIKQFNMSDIVLRDIRLVGSVASPNAYEAALALIAAGKIKAEACVTHRFKLSEVEKAIATQEKEIEKRIKILLYPGE